jgi:hypothetical protein
LLKASVGAEIFDEEWHPVSTRYTNSIENVAVRATMCERDTIDLRHGGKQAAITAHWRDSRQNSTLQLLQGVGGCCNSLSLVSFLVIVR